MLLANYRFNLEEWLPRMPLEEHLGKLTEDGEQIPFSGEIITSPSQLVRNEHLRRELRDQVDWGEPVPIDIFVMAEGEPADRHVTKIGGLPWLPRDEPWPCGSGGQPMTFLGQFCFSDSTDLTGELPGDVLLIFCEDNDSPVESPAILWQPLGLKELIAPADVPEQPWKFHPCYGYIWRTANYPDAQPKPKYAKAEYLRCRGIDVWSDHHVFNYQATMIGSAPFYIQGDPELTGRPLCTLSSVDPDYDSRWPWVNCADPLPDDRRFSSDYLMLGDVGCLYFSLDDDGEVHFEEQCY